MTAIRYRRLHWLTKLLGYGNVAWRKSPAYRYSAVVIVVWPHRRRLCAMRRNDSNRLFARRTVWLGVIRAHHQLTIGGIGLAYFFSIFISMAVTASAINGGWPETGYSQSGNVSWPAIINGVVSAAIYAATSGVPAA